MKNSNYIEKNRLCKLLLIYMVKERSGFLRTNLEGRSQC